MDEPLYRELLAIIDELKRQLAERDATIAAQAERIKAQEEVIASQAEQLAAQSELIDKLSSDVKLLKRALYGNRRERFQEDPNQLLLFDGQVLEEARGSEAPPAEESEADQKKPSRRRGKRRKVIFPETLPRKEIVHRLRDEDVPEELRGNPAVRHIRKQVREYVEQEKASVFVVVEYVEQLALDNADATETRFVSAARPKRLVSSSVGDRLLAELAVDRFADYLPYYRLEERLARLQIRFPRKTIAGWMIRLAEELGPLLRPMHSIVLGSSVLCVDETPHKLLVPGAGKASTAYLWTVVGDAAHPYDLFFFTTNRSRAGPEDFLAGYRGVLVSDAYAGYESLQSLWSDEVRWACCHAHARRKFEQLHFLGSTKDTRTVLGWFTELFDIEDQARDATAGERHELRQRRSRPIIAAMKEWMDEKLEKLRPKSPLRGAILYMTSRWDAFTRFLESGDIPLENNAAERAIKLPVIGRKNSLFFGSVAGGHAAMALYSLMATCRRHCIDPSAYLHDVITRLPTASDADIEALLPDHWAQSHPEHRITIRAAEKTHRATTKRIRRTARRNLATPSSR